MIYIIDDAEDFRFLLQQLFARFLPQYSVRFFENGEVFYRQAIAGAERPRLILLDRHMPRMDGLQTLQRIKQPAYNNPTDEGLKGAWDTVPVVMMSSINSSETIEECYKAGANSFVTKPMDFNSLHQTLEGVCSYWLELNQLPTY
jgi:CheY-like chemotaxis protein